VVALSRLEIQVVPAESAHRPRVVLLVDGQDVLAEQGHQGFGPESLLHRGDPLTPVSPPRRVVLYHCGCGVAGCSGRACVISESDGIVRWSGFRRFVGLGHPLDDTIADEHGRTDDLPDLAFDAAQYRAEVERAKNDRSWETPRRRLARLLTERLAAETRRWNDLGFEFGSVWLWSDEEEIYAVNLRRHGDQLLIGIRAEPGTDEAAVVSAMAADVLCGDERTWFVIYDQRRPSLPVDPP
jgi:hypothetical protein